MTTGEICGIVLLCLPLGIAMLFFALMAIFCVLSAFLEVFDLWEPFKKAVREWILGACK